MPRSTDTDTIIHESFGSPGYGLITATPDANRQVLLSKANPSGPQAIYHRVVIRQTTTDAPPAPAAEPRLIRSAYQGANRAAAQGLLAAVSGQAADTETLIALLLRRLRNPQPSDEVQLLLGSASGNAELAAALVNILALDNRPARSVHGIVLAGESRDARFTHWLEAYVDGVWQPFNVSEGTAGAPAKAVPWWRGRTLQYQISNVDNVERTISLRQTFEFTLPTAIARTREINPGLLEFSLFGLPLHVQAVYQILLVLPVGVLLIVLLRNVIGIKTFGTFMPVLVALAFRETELLWGIVLFAIVLAIGLAVRTYLERLKLLLVPRLAAVVVTVIIVMVMLSILSNTLGFERGLSVALFPIVILAMTIERMSITWEERGAGEALQEAGGSLLVAIVAYLAMSIVLLQHLAFVFPELLLAVLALTLLLGRYTGYRLTEIFRFKVLAGK